MFETEGTLAFFAIIAEHLQNEINAFTNTALGTMMNLINAAALSFMTLWFVFEGYRIISGQSRTPMMGFVMRSGKALIVLLAATGMHMASSDIIANVNGLRDGITELITGTHTNVYDLVDDNLKTTDRILSGINSLQSTLNSLADKKSASESLTTALFASGIGGASPAIVGGTLSLLNQIALSLGIIFGPLSILCLLTDKTASIFWNWLQYCFGVLFSMAILAIVSGWALEITEKYAQAIILADIGNAIAGLFAGGAGGYTSMSQTALMQGGIGLLMTTLLVTVPPMTMKFFNSTVGGSFSGYSLFNGGGKGGDVAGSPGKTADQPNSGGDPTGSHSTISTNNKASASKHADTSAAPGMSGYQRLFQSAIEKIGTTVQPAGDSNLSSGQLGNARGNSPPTSTPSPIKA
ncbi:type IV secretion system protein [Leeia oryzae]|uniref:type IV secretion system protein n=1 Tax=Leeia oryzae TaxID=356662 RepID=UPI000360A330|nr:type IV secretion system protein [Leeia oryzae]